MTAVAAYTCNECMYNLYKKNATYVLYFILDLYVKVLFINGLEADSIVTE